MLCARMISTICTCTNFSTIAHMPTERAHTHTQIHRKLPDICIRVCAMNGASINTSDALNKPYTMAIVVGILETLFTRDCSAACLQSALHAYAAISPRPRHAPCARCIYASASACFPCIHVSHDARSNRRHGKTNLIIFKFSWCATLVFSTRDLSPKDGCRAEQRVLPLNRLTYSTI